MSNADIAWHEENLKNKKVTLNGKRQELSRLEGDYRRLLSDCRFLSDQIDAAKEAGVDSFDTDRFLRKIPAKG